MTPGSVVQHDIQCAVCACTAAVGLMVLYVLSERCFNSLTALLPLEVM
jgi:hypothetical protein